MLPLQLIAIGAILIGTVLLGVVQKGKKSDKNKKHGNRRRSDDPSGEPDTGSTGGDGARRVGPRLKGKGNARVVDTALVVDGGNGTGNNRRGKSDPAPGSDIEPSLDGDQETEGGKPPKHKEGAGGEPAAGKQPKKKKEKAVADAKS